MATPVSTLARGTVTGKFLRSDDTAVDGSITFTPSLSRALVGGATVFLKPVTVSLKDGSFSASLIATTNVGMTPPRFVYTVSFSFGIENTRLEVPANSTTDISDAVPVGINAYGLPVLRGEPGPAGPRGPKGDTGAPGPAGIDGATNPNALTVAAQTFDTTQQGQARRNINAVAEDELVFNVKKYGAKGNGTADDTAAIQATISAAKSALTFSRGACVFFPAGTYNMSAPAILPRTGATPTTVVSVRGATTRSVLLQGLNTFPTGRAMIEWEATTSRTWHQEISSLSMRLPTVAGTRAIHYKRNGTGTTLTDFNNERMQIALMDIVVEGNNGFHSSLVKLEGQVFYSKFERVFGDNAVSALINGYPPLTDVDTATFEFETSTFGDPVSSDITGLSYSSLLNCGGGSLRRGGRGVLIRGKVKASTIRDGWCDGGRYDAGIDLINSFNVHVENCNNEGRSAPQIRLTNSQAINLDKIAPSAQDPEFPDWVASTAYTTAVGVVVPGWRSATTSPAPANNNWYKCTTAGTSASSAPSWPTALGATVTDGTVTWTCMGPAVQDAVLIDGGKDISLDRIACGPGLPNFSARGVDMIRLLNNPSNVTATRCACPGDPRDEIAWNTAAGTGDFTSQRTGERVRFGNDAFGSTVVNVKDFGAKGDGIADDTSAINAAITAAKGKGPNTKVLFPATVAGSYKTTATITFDGGVVPDMQVPIISSVTGAPAIVLGAAVGDFSVNRLHRMEARVKVKRATVSDWTNENEVGVRIINAYYCRIYVDQAENFTIGCETRADAGGFAYSEVNFGRLGDNKIGHEVAAYNTGWVNQNQFYGGSWNVGSTQYDGLAGRTAKDRYGVRLGLGDSTYLSNNSNTWYSPSFEIYGQNSALFRGVPILVQAANVGNKFLNCRNELSEQDMVELTNNAFPPQVTMSYDSAIAAPRALETGTRAGTIIEKEFSRVADAAKRTVFKADALHRRACYANGATSVNVPGLAVQTSATAVDDARHNTGLTIGADALTIATNRMVGIYMSTRAAKRFTLLADADSGGRFSVRCYNAAGTIIDSTAATTPVKNDRNVLSYTTAFGGSWTAGTDSLAPLHVTLSSDVDYVFIGVRGGSAAAVLRSFSILALDVDALPATWLPWQDNGYNYGTTPPTAGAWEVGRQIFNAAPVAGGSAGWVCTGAGTPGTWVPFGPVSTGSLTLNVKDYGALGNDSADDAPAITACLNAARAARPFATQRVRVIIPPGVYQLGSGLNGGGLEVQGYGATLKIKAGVTAFNMIQGFNLPIWVYGVTFDGNKANTTSPASPPGSGCGIYMHQAAGGEIGAVQDCKIINCWGPGIRCSGTVVADAINATFSPATLTNVTIDNCDRGIWTPGVNGVTISRCTITNSVSAGIWADNCKDVTIDKCLVDTTTGPDSSCITSSYSYGIIITNNKCYRSKFAGITLGGGAANYTSTRNFKVVGNHCESNYYHGITVDLAVVNVPNVSLLAGASITANTCKLNGSLRPNGDATPPYGNGIYLKDAINVAVNSNICDGNYSNGIALNGRKLSAEGNVTINNGLYGIELRVLADSVNDHGGYRVGRGNVGGGNGAIAAGGVHPKYDIFTQNSVADSPVNLTGTGSPEGVYTGCVGSTYQRSDGGGGTTFYVKETPASVTTGWVAQKSPDLTSQTASTERVNLVQNPLGVGFKTTYGWVGTRGDLSMQPGCLRLTITDTTATDMSQRINSRTTTFQAVEPSTVRQFQAKVRSNTGLPCKLVVVFYTSTGTLISSTSSTTATPDSSSFSLLSVQATTPATAAFAYLQVGLSGTAARTAGQWLDIKELFVGDPGVYFDGSTGQAAGAITRWSAAVGDSVSFASAVPAPALLAGSPSTTLPSTQGVSDALSGIKVGEERLSLAIFGAKGDGVTDDTAALLEAVRRSRPTRDTPAAGMSGFRLTVPPGEYLLSDTVQFYRWAGIFEGAGIGNSPSYSVPGNASVFRWIGAADRPMFRLKDSRHVSFRDMRLEGNDASKPTYLIECNNLAADTQGHNSNFTFENLYLGTYSWSSQGVDKGAAGAGIGWTGDNASNDQFVVRDSYIRGCGKGLYLPNLQSIWSAVEDTTIFGCTVGIQTSATLSGRDVRFAYCGKDVQADDYAQVQITDWYSEHSGLVAHATSRARIIARGGLWTLHSDLGTNPFIQHDSAIDSSGVILDGLYVSTGLATHPKIRMTATAASSHPGQLSIRDCRLLMELTDFDLITSGTGVIAVNLQYKTFNVQGLRVSGGNALTAAPSQLAGWGTPEGVVTATPGSTFQRRDGGAATSYYVKETGTGNTGWVAK